MIKLSNKSDAKNDAQRFGGEFGPYRKPGTTGVPLSTFKTLVWTSNIGGLLLCVIALEMLFVRQMFFWGLMAMLGGVAIALFPSNYEIVGMSDDGDSPQKMTIKKKASKIRQASATWRVQITYNSPDKKSDVFKKQYQTLGLKFFSSNRTVITMSKNDPFWDLKTDSGSSRRALAFSGLKMRLRAPKSHFFKNLHATLDLQVLIFS